MLSKLVLASFLTLFSFSANAQSMAQQCNERPKVLKQLAQQYNEIPINLGLAANGNVIELLTSKSGETWTLVITLPSGMTCLMASGQAWVPVTVKNDDPES